ncbi:MAG TPA: tRNA-dihydrouridine synthase family protein [Candidatus Blautia stercoravium]|nr:tRNA-dihydrouridine synthase family protein [Candidatus Blautia stercoravium]
MKYYFAPMEGITGYLYRRVHHNFFPGMDKYFTPFLSPGPKKVLTDREIRDILPENNTQMYIVPQILTNRAEDFIRVEKELERYGYREVNFNLGCPSGTVTAKKKGAGFLEYTEDLKRFLDEVFQKPCLEISIKTRIGKEDPEEFAQLLHIYNQYPLKELIIHPRVQTDYYRNTPNKEVFAEAVKNSKNPVCYNGDLFDLEKCQAFETEFPQVDICMLGRGLLVNPALVRELKGGKMLEKQELREFHDALCREYEAVMSGDRNVLFKMKELWFYMGHLFEENKKQMKKIKKAQKLSDYMEAVDSLFEEGKFYAQGTFQ